MPTLEGCNRTIVSSYNLVLRLQLLSIQFPFQKEPKGQYLECHSASPRSFHERSWYVFLACVYSQLLMAIHIRLRKKPNGKD